MLKTVYNQKQICSSGNLRGQWGHQQGMGQYEKEHQNFGPRELGYCESKHRKPWFDQECSKLVDRRKQAKNLSG
jgi:hypothetical protein